MSNPVDIKIAHIKNQENLKGSLDKDKVFEVFQSEVAVEDILIENNPKIFAAIIAMIIGLLSKNVLATIFSGLISYWFLIFVVFS